MTRSPIVKAPSSHSASPRRLESWLSRVSASGRSAARASPRHALPSKAKPATNSVWVMGSMLLSAAIVQPIARARRDRVGSEAAECPFPRCKSGSLRTRTASAPVPCTPGPARTAGRRYARAISRRPSLPRRRRASRGRVETDLLQRPAHAHVFDEPARHLRNPAIGGDFGGGGGIDGHGTRHAMRSSIRIGSLRMRLPVA